MNNARGIYMIMFEFYRQAFAEQGKTLKIVSLEYTLAPGAKFPVQRNEFVACYKHLIETVGVSPKKLLVGGDSAGANLVATSLLHMRNSNSGLPMPAFALMLSPWINLAADSAESITKWDADWMPRELPSPFFVRPEEMSLHDPGLSPLYDNSLAGFPSQVVLYGGEESLTGDIKAWIAKSRAHGVDTTTIFKKDGQHDWMVAPVGTEEECKNTCKKATAIVLSKLT